MKRRDFVKFAALLPIAPAMVAASQFAEPKQADSTDCPTFPAKSCRDGWHTELTCIDTKRPRLNGFWVTFDNIEKQTNFFKGRFGNKDFWHLGDMYFGDCNTVYGVETVCAGKDSEEMTRVSFGSTHFYIGTGAKISINVADSSTRIEHISWSGTALDWKWTRETYEETVIRVATEFDAFNPEWLLPFARAERVSQRRIKSWMWDKKYGDGKLELKSRFKADVTAGLGN